MIGLLLQELEMQVKSHGISVTDFNLQLSSSSGMLLNSFNKPSSQPPTSSVIPQYSMFLSDPVSI